MTHEEKIQWMAMWASKNHCALELTDGECGIGRECIGILSTWNGCYPDYEWSNDDFERLDDNGFVWTPPDAYHKHPCVAVLGRGEEAESQLYNWLKWFDENNFKLETGDNELTKDKAQLLWDVMFGRHKYARMVKQRYV
jgi:hypothetical protein